MAVREPLPTRCKGSHVLAKGASKVLSGAGCLTRAPARRRWLQRMFMRLLLVHLLRWTTTGRCPSSGTCFGLESVCVTRQAVAALPRAAQPQFHVSNPNMLYPRRSHALQALCEQFHLQTILPAKRTVLVERCDIIGRVAAQLQATRDAEDSQACLEWLNASYLHAVFASESGQQLEAGVTVEAIYECLRDGRTLPPNIPERSSAKLTNLWCAMQQLGFHKFSATDDPPLRLSNDLVVALHATVMKGLLDQTGFRSTSVVAAQTNVVYLPPQLIRTHLADLLEFSTRRLAACSTILDRVLLVSFFFSEFLKIHPFVNGNRRVALLLANALLRGAAVVPFTPAGVGAAAREHYLQAICESQWHSNHMPLIELFITAGFAAAGHVSWMIG